MANPVFNARFTPTASAEVESGIFTVEADIHDGSGIFSGYDVQEEDIVYLDTFNSSTSPNTVSKYVVTEVTNRDVGTVIAKLKYSDDGDIIDPGEVLDNPGFISRPSGLNHLAFHAAPTIHNIPDYVVQYARDKEMFEKIDPSLNGQWVTPVHTITSEEATAKQFTMTPAPKDPSEVDVEVEDAPPQLPGFDFVITGSTFGWAGLGLDGLLEEGDRVRFEYFS